MLKEVSGLNLPFLTDTGFPSATPMDARTKTCLFCLKPRQILVDNPNTAKAIEEIYNIKLPQDGCRICIECHFNIARVQDFKRTIENAADFDVDSCFVCKSETTVNEPGVDRVVDYLIKQCTTIDFGNTDTIKACVTCMHVLETSIKYEKMARNYANAQRFCKQYSTLKECNIALWKIDLDTLGEICDDGGGGRRIGPKGCKNKKKRARSSLGGDDTPAKKSKLEDGSVLPVMLTKLTPTGAKKISPPSSKGKISKQNDKIFIKLPLFTRPKKKLKSKKYGAPHSPSRSIPATPSVDDLNRIFNVELRPLTVRIEHVDLSSFMNKTIAHDKANRQIRKPKKEEFIGLDEEDVVELQNTSMNSSISKRKSILITDRTESPNSTKKKVQFSDSPSIKYVDKLDFSDDDNSAKDKSDEDEDYEVKTAKKRGPKPQNGTSPSTPENGKPRPRGRPKKIPNENGEDGQKAESDTANESEAKKVNEDVTKESEPEVAKDEAEHEEVSPKQQQEEQQPAVEEGKAVTEGNAEGETKSDKHEDDTGSSEPKNDTSVEQSEPPVAAEEDKPLPDASTVAEMETEDADSSESMKVDQIDQPPADAEMKAVDSPEDVEMVESKSPPTEDVEMKEVASTSPEATETEKETALSNDTASTIPETTEKVDSATESKETVSTKEDEPTPEFETSDKEEEEMDKFKQTLSNILGQEVSDSDQGLSQDSQDNAPSKPVADEKHEESEAAPSSEPSEKDEPKSETPNNTDLETPPVNDSDENPAGNESPEKKNQSFASLEDVDDISDDDDILDRLDDADESTGRKRSPDLPPLGEDSL